jgi:perosamine synthetase
MFNSKDAGQRNRRTTRSGQFPFFNTMYTDLLPQADPLLQRIPRSPVLGTHRLGGPTKNSSWPRIDGQGKACFPISGRVSILLALRAIGFVAGDHLLVPTYHCPTMVEPCVLLGGEPRFYPIASDGTPKLDALRALDTSRVKAILAAHLFGLPMDLRRLRQFCDERGIWLIEDCAHAYFGSSAAGPVGTTGDLVVGSLPKFFPAVEGGCLVVRSASLALPTLNRPDFKSELRTIWNGLELGAAAGRLGVINSLVLALIRLKTRLKADTTLAPLGTREKPGAASSLYTTIDAARIEQGATAATRWAVQRIDVQRSASKRRLNYLLFAQLLGNEERLRPLFPTLPEGAVPYVFPIFVDNPEPAYQALRARGVPLYRWDIAWPGTPVVDGDAGTIWSTRVFQLCCHEDISAEDIELISNAVKHECYRSPR